MPIPAAMCGPVHYRIGIRQLQQMQVHAIAQLEPSARKPKFGPIDQPQSEYLPIKRQRRIHIGNHDTDMIHAQ
jgi:hypothetical protein